MLACPSCGSVYSRSQEFCGLDGTRLVEVETDPLIGRSIERYVIDRTLGSGGMARVYRARHKVLERKVAIKVLYGELSADHRLARRFEREAHSLSRIRHPNIVEVLDFGRTDTGLLYMIMELLEGRTLGLTLKRGPIELRESVRIASDIARGLQAVHALGYVHRDLKPQNVVLDRRSLPPAIKILDFGLVGLIEGDPQDTPLTRQGAFFGTPIYMSPEQAAGEVAGPAADMYALGIILYELLTGKPPFSGEVRQLAHQHIYVTPKPPSEVETPLADLVLRLLQKDPNERPKPSELLETLEDLDYFGKKTPHRSSSIIGKPPPLEEQRRLVRPDLPKTRPIQAPDTPQRATDKPSKRPTRTLQDPLSDLSVPVPIDRDEFSVMDGSSHIYEREALGSTRRTRIALGMLLIVFGGLISYATYTWDSDTRSFRLPGSTERITLNPIIQLLFAQPTSNSLDNTRHTISPNADSPTKPTPQPSVSPTKSKKQDRVTKLSATQHKTDSTSTAVPMIETGSTPKAEGLSPQTQPSPNPFVEPLSETSSTSTTTLRGSYLTPEAFLRLETQLRQNLGDARVDWETLSTIHPSDTHKWEHWKSQTQVPEKDALKVFERLNTTIQQQAATNPAQLMTRLRRVQAAFADLPIEIDEQRFNAYRHRLGSLERALLGGGRIIAPEQILDALEELRADIREAAQATPLPDDEALDALMKKIESSTSSYDDGSE